jgi:quercetin dioxygenase-like cupin family protein
LSDLLVELQERYGGPVLIAETGASGEERPGWITYIAGEAKRAIERGVDLQGICLYPVVSSPDWEDTTAFFDGGLFDTLPQPDGSLKRLISPGTVEALRKAQTLLDPQNLPTEVLNPEPWPASGNGFEPEPELQLARPLENVPFKADNFSCQTLIAGESLLVQVYGLCPGARVSAHRHESTEHVLTVMSGEARVCAGRHTVILREGDTLLVPAGDYHAIGNDGSERLVVQQVSSPKPWDARFGGPHPRCR